MKTVTIGIIGFVLVAGGVWFLTFSPDAAPVARDTMHQKQDMATDHASAPNEAMPHTDTDAMHEPGSYQSYSPEKTALAATEKVVLFFHASWCPTCRALDADINAHLSDIPEHIVILDVDYDTAASLRQKYGVTIQHTLVQVDADGAMLQKWTGSPTLAELVSHIK